MAAYRRVYDLRSPAGWLPAHRDQLRAQRSVSSMGRVYLFNMQSRTKTDPNTRHGPSWDETKNSEKPRSKPTVCNNCSYLCTHRCAQLHYRPTVQLTVRLDVDSSGRYRRTYSPSWLVWSEGWQPPGARFTFNKWTWWTIAMALPWRQHHKRYQYRWGRQIYKLLI